MSAKFSAVESDQLSPSERFISPSSWSIWAGWLWMRMAASIPLKAAIRIHEAVGVMAHRLPTTSRRIVLRNLELCFPELSADERWQLSKAHFRAMGAGLAECAAGWFASDAALEGHFDLEGLEHIEAALHRGQGVILYTGHFTPLEICGRPLKQAVPHFACMMSQRSNALMDRIQSRGRLRCAHEIIASDKVRALLASLKRNAVVWYAPDQRPHFQSAKLIPFFGEPAMTNVATGRIAGLSGAAVVPFRYSRIPGTARYRLRFSPALTDFPSGDVVADTTRLTGILEDDIRCCPEQYFWKQKKFKGRPEMADPYARRSTEPGNSADDQSEPPSRPPRSTH